MSRFAILLVLGMSFTASAQDLLPPWNVQCTRDRSKCWLELLLPFQGSKKQDIGGIAIAYDNAAKKPLFVTIFVPPDTGNKHEVIIAFIDSVPDGNGWKLKPASTGLMDLPVMECDRQFCMARVQSEIDNGDGTSTDLLSELNKRRLLWVLFQRNGKPERFMIPVSGFAAALAQAQSMPVEAIPVAQPVLDDTAGHHR